MNWTQGIKLPESVEESTLTGLTCIYKVDEYPTQDTMMQLISSKSTTLRSIHKVFFHVQFSVKPIWQSSVCTDITANGFNKSIVLIPPCPIASSSAN